MIVYVNGLAQIPGIDYMASANAVSFNQAPAMGSNISIQLKSGTICQMKGDGSNNLFQFAAFTDLNKDRDTYALLDEAFKHRRIPAVADALERLQVVVELAKQ